MGRRIVILLFLTSLLTACFSKKRAAYEEERREGDKAVNSQPDKTKGKDQVSLETGLYPMLDGTETFEVVNITSVEDYINTFAQIAQFEMQEYGIPASITLAQGILESGAGQGELTLNTNNHFGIKCHVGWDGPYHLYDDDAKGECFRKYNHPMYSFRDHSIFLSTRPRYAFLFDLSPDDYKRWAKGLKQAGYATDKQYPKKLISLIERYHLYEYDTITLKKGRVKQPKPQMQDYTVHRVEKGDTLYSISRKYFVSVPDLKQLNNLKGDLISIGQELVVRPGKINK